jgi:hypothetical protein
VTITSPPFCTEDRGRRAESAAKPYRDIVPTDAEYIAGARVALIQTPGGRDAFAWSFDEMDALTDEANRAALADALREMSDAIRGD